MDVIFKALLNVLLSLNLLLHLLCRFCHSFLTHAQVVDDKNQILVNAVEVFLFRAHFVSLIIQLFNFSFFRADVPLKLFYFVVKYELELLQFFLYLL